MNAQLLNPFTIDIPDSVASTLETAECTTCLFNHGFNALHGQYLAVGRNDGYITIWDIETRSVLRLLAGHVRPITGLAWSSYNRYLASCSGDWNMIVWDLAAKSSAGPVLRADPAGSTSSAGEGTNQNQNQDTRLPFASERKTTIRFDCPVSSVQFAPGNSKKLIIVLASQQAYLVDIQDKLRVRRRKMAAGPSSMGPETVEFEVEVESAPVRTPLVGVDVGAEGETNSPAITAARFSPDSRFIVTGTSKGGILVFDASTGQLLDDKKVLGTASGVKELTFDAAGRYLVVNSNDRAIRILSVSTIDTSPHDDPSSSPPRSHKRRRTTLELTLLHKIQDMIQRTAWNRIGFSPSSDYIYAGAAHKAAHNIYIWDRSSGTLSKILEGPKDWLIGVDWHPNRPMLASVSNTGAIYVWFTPTEEIWSAYAPGFEELEENIEYEEKEDEFDFIDDQDNKNRRKQQEEEAAYVRITDHDVTATRLVTKNESRVDVNQVFGSLDIPHDKREARCCKAFESIAKHLHQLSTDSGWSKSSSSPTAPDTTEEQGGQVRELVFTLLDDDNSDTFVIPPRLEIDYSDFHDDHT